MRTIAEMKADPDSVTEEEMVFLLDRMMDMSAKLSKRQLKSVAARVKKQAAKQKMKPAKGFGK